MDNSKNHLINVYPGNVTKYNFPNLALLTTLISSTAPLLTQGLEL